MNINKETRNRLIDILTVIEDSMHTCDSPRNAGSCLPCMSSGLIEVFKPEVKKI